MTFNLRIDCTLWLDPKKRGDEEFYELIGKTWNNYLV